VPETNRLKSIAITLERPIALLALLVVPALILEDRATSPGLQLTATVLNWVVWVAFCVEFVLLFAAEPRWATVRRGWFAILLIVLTPPFVVPQYLQAARGLRAFRIVRLVRLARAGAVAAVGLRLSQRAFSHKKFHLIVLIATALIVLGALAIHRIEGETNPSVRTFGDALWWAVVTATTVGYGDISPTTLEGRVIAVLLMLTGIGVVGVFTATIASFFFEQGKSADADVVARLETIERKLDELLERGENQR
jgi:voltage-gated potassium channel